MTLGREHLAVTAAGGTVYRSVYSAHPPRVFVIGGGDQPGSYFTGSVEALRIDP
jgi:hypothetical protein